MYALADPRKQLAQNQFRSSVNMDQPFRHTNLLTQETPQRRRIGFRVVVAPGQLLLCRGDRFVQWRERILAEQHLDAFKCPAAFFEYRFHIAPP